MYGWEAIGTTVKSCATKQLQRRRKPHPTGRNASLRRLSDKIKVQDRFLSSHLYCALVAICPPDNCERQFMSQDSIR